MHELLVKSIPKIRDGDSNIPPFNFTSLQLTILGTLLSSLPWSTGKHGNSRKP